MVTDKQGNPLSETKDRRDEIQRCIDIIGWGWGKFGDRVGLKLPSSYAVKNCKRTIADSDIRWLQDLAEAHIARPRPMEQNDTPAVIAAPLNPVPISVATNQLGQTTQGSESVANEPLGQTSLADSNQLNQIREEIAEQSTVALVSGITSVYLAAVPGLGPDAMTTEQVAGARWALGELAQSLGVLDLVQDQLRAHQARAAAHPGAQGGTQAGGQARLGAIGGDMVAAGAAAIGGARQPMAD